MRMNRLQLFNVLSIFVTLNQCGLCQDLSFQLRKVEISGDNTGQVSADNVKLYKDYRRNRYYFIDVDLHVICDGFFSPSDIDIRSAYLFRVSFSITKPNVNSVVKCEFANGRDLQTFFNDIREHDRTVYRRIPVNQVFYYPIDRDKYPNQSVQPVTSNCLFHRRDIPKSKKVGADASFYLVRPKELRGIEFEDAQLVFLSKKFTLKELIGANMYALCSENVPDLVFILRFSDHQTAMEFISIVKDHTREDEVHCPIDWLTEERKTFMETFEASLHHA